MSINKLEKIFELSSNILGPSIFGLVLGSFIDNYFGRKIFTPTFFVLGIIVGIWSLIKFIRKMLKDLLK